MPICIRRSERRRPLGDLRLCAQRVNLYRRFSNQTADRLKLLSALWYSQAMSLNLPIRRRVFATVLSCTVSLWGFSAVAASAPIPSAWSADAPQRAPASILQTSEHAPERKESPGGAPLRATKAGAGGHEDAPTFRLPSPDPVAGEATFARQVQGDSGPAQSTSDGATCGGSEQQLAICCAAAGVSGMLGADACRRGDVTTALLAGGVFSILASGVIGGFVGWQYAQAVGMEDAVLATQIGAGVGMAGSLVTVGGAMLVLGSGSACLTGCLGCKGSDGQKPPKKKKKRSKRRRPRGHSL